MIYNNIDLSFIEQGITNNYVENLYWLKDHLIKAHNNKNKYIAIGMLLYKTLPETVNREMVIAREINDFPYFIDVYNAIAEDMVKEKRYEEALQVLSYSKHSIEYCVLNDIIMPNQYNFKSESDYKSYLSINNKAEWLEENISKTYHMLGVLCEARDKINESIDFLTSELKYNPMNYDLLIKIAELYNRVGDCLMSNNYLKLAAKICTNNKIMAKIYVSLAIQYLKLGKCDLAAALFYKAKQLGYGEIAEIGFNCVCDKMNITLSEDELEQKLIEYSIVQLAEK